MNQKTEPKVENRDGKKVWKAEFSVKMSIEFETDADATQEDAEELALEGEDNMIEKWLRQQGINGEVDYDGFDGASVEFHCGPYEAQVNVKGELIEADERFPHRVTPNAVCLACKRRVTLVFPNNMHMTECTCKCGERAFMAIEE